MNPSYWLVVFPNFGWMNKKSPDLNNHWWFSFPNRKRHKNFPVPRSAVFVVGASWLEMMKSRVSPKMMVGENVSERLLNMAIYFGHLLVKLRVADVETYPMFDRVLVKISRWFSCNFTQKIGMKWSTDRQGELSESKKSGDLRYVLGNLLANIQVLAKPHPLKNNGRNKHCEKTIKLLDLHIYTPQNCNFSPEKNTKRRHWISSILRGEQTTFTSTQPEENFIFLSRLDFGMKFWKIHLSAVGRSRLHPANKPRGFFHI